MKTDLALLGGIATVQRKPDPWPPMGPEEVEAVASLTRRSELSYYGREGSVAELEDAFGAYHQARYALAVSSGTAALHSAYVAIGIGPGDEVIAPTHTFLATVLPIVATNGVPVLVDCEQDNEGLDPAAVERAVTKRTKAIVVTHLWGHPVEMDPILDIGRRYGLRVIEDCSHAHGSTYKGKKVGVLGDIGCFSLQSKKIIAAGQGGILITNDQELYERAVLFGHFRVRSEQCVSLPHLKPFADTGYGLNYRMHPLAAALAVVQLRKLDERIELRQAKLQYLSRGLAQLQGIVPPSTRPHVTRGAFYGYKPRYYCERLCHLPMDLYIRALSAEGLEIKRTGSAPLHLSPVFAGISTGFDNFTHSRPDKRPGYSCGDLPVSESIHSVSLSLPTFTYEPYELIDKYLDAFVKVHSQVDRLLQIADQDILLGSAVGQ